MCLWKGTGNAICHGLCVCVCVCVCVRTRVCVCWLPEQQSLFQPLISSRNNHLIRRAQTHARADTHTHTHTLIQMTRLWAPLHSTYVRRRDANTHALTLVQPLSVLQGLTFISLTSLGHGWQRSILFKHQNQKPVDQRMRPVKPKAWRVLSSLLKAPRLATIKNQWAAQLNWLSCFPH